MVERQTSRELFDGAVFAHFIHSFGKPVAHGHRAYMWEPRSFNLEAVMMLCTWSATNMRFRKVGDLPT